MSVVIIWSSTGPDGDAISDPKDYGVIAAGSHMPAQDLYVRHTGTAKITDCEWYIQAYSGDAYAGDFGATIDYNELIAWGDNDGTLTGGYKINQNEPTFPAGSRTVCKTGQGTASAPITLSADSIVGGGAAGEIGVDEESHIQADIFVPSDEDTAGTRMIELVLAYTYTS